MNPRAGLKRAQKPPLAQQILPPATQPRLEDSLQLSALQASMPRNAQLHKAKVKDSQTQHLWKDGLCNHLQN